MDIRYPGGHYFVPPKAIPAGGTASFDLRKIISEQKPDNQGNVIPLSTTGGQFHWSVFGSPPSSRFIGRSEVISASRRVGSSYSCPGCCPDSGPFGTINPTSPIIVGASFTASTTGAVYDGCTGYATTVGWFQMDFWMGDFSIASYTPGSGSSTLVTGLKPGSTALHGSYFWQMWESDGWSMCWETRGENEEQQPVDVKPTITGPNVVWWFNGANPGNANMPVSIQLSTQTTGNSYSWTATANGNLITLQNQTTNTVTIAGASQSEDVGDIKIKVTVNGVASDEFSFTVKAPNKLNHHSISHTIHATFGYQTEIRYTIRDQFETLLPAGNIKVNEDFTGSKQVDFTGSDWRMTPDAGHTADNPIFADIIQGETSEKTPTPQAPQSPNLGTTKVVHWGQDIYVGSDQVGSGKKVQTCTFQKYRDHAAHENIASPVP